MDTESWKLPLKLVFSLGANNHHLETEINYIRQVFWKKKHNNNKVLAILVAKFPTQWLFAFHFPEILLITVN